MAQRPMSKSQLKAQLSKAQLKELKKTHKQQQKKNLQRQYEHATGDTVEMWDDGKSIGSKEQRKKLRALGEELRQKDGRLQKLVIFATLHLVLWWFWVVFFMTSLDPAVRLLIGLFSIPLGYYYSQIVVAPMMKQLHHNQQQMWWFAPRIWNEHTAFFEIYPHGPTRLMVTFLTMHLIYRVANLFDSGGVPRALEAGDQTLLQLCMLVFIPTIFALFIVLVFVVFLPTQAVELCWFSRNRNTGRWFQFASYVVLDILIMMCYGLPWLFELVIADK